MAIIPHPGNLHFTLSPVQFIELQIRCVCNSVSIYLQIKLTGIKKPNEPQSSSSSPASASTRVAHCQWPRRICHGRARRNLPANTSCSARVAAATAIATRHAGSPIGRSDILRWAMAEIIDGIDGLCFPPLTGARQIFNGRRHAAFSARV